MIILHGHTEHSIKESPMKVGQYIETAKQKGCTDLAITDTDAMTGVVEFADACKDIHPIIGVELHVRQGKTRGTMVFLAKNQNGYRWISRMVKEANRTKEQDLPCLPMEKLTPSDDIVVLSSSIRGFLSETIIESRRKKAEIQNLEEKMAKLPGPKEEAYLGNLKKIEEIDEEIRNFEQERTPLVSDARKKYERPLLALENLKGTPEYDRKKKDLDEQIRKTKEASARISDIDDEVKKLKQLRGIIQRKIKAMEKTHAEWNKCNEELEQKRAEVQDEARDKEDARAHMVSMKKLFPSYYVELQYHGRSDEATVMPMLARIAREEHIGIVMENEPYIAEKEDAEIRQIMISMQDNTWIKADPTDSEYYIKEENEFKTYVSDAFPPDMIEEAFENQKKIASECTFVITKENHYPKYKEEGMTDAASLLRSKVEKGLKERFGEITEEYRKRAEYELDVIIRMGFADYLLIVQDFIQYGKWLAKENNPEKVGYGIGPGRGSAAGSLVCYALGITNLDPLKYNLKFERFLNVERVSMPDIDTDFSAEIRPACIEYVSEKYGRDSVALIRTKSTQKAKAAIRNVTRIISDRDYGDRRHLAGLGDQMAKIIPNEPKVKLADYEKELLAVNDGKGGKLTKEIYETALKVENLMTGLGVHAAGVIIGDGNPLSDYIPLLYNEEMEAWAVQCDMVEAEEIGLLKMDFLGLKNLDIMSECIRRIHKYTGKEIDLDTIPFEDEVFRDIFSTGQTGAVFQFESAGMRDMLQRFQPSSFDDIILLVAAYRPGPIDSIPEIIKVKQGKKKPNYCIPELEPILSNTYGYPIYQEQLMDIFAICAGFTPGEADNVRRFMSKKKTDKFLAVKPKFIEGIIAHGASEKDAEELWNSLVSFSAYAFNKSHAAAYAWIAYQTAWLKYHYKEYYMCAVLNNSDPKKYKGILYECREMGINIQLPDINQSEMDFENTKDGILYGLGKIKSVRTQAQMVLDERKNGFFRSYKDFVARTGIGEKLAATLVNAGCFDGFRKGMRRAFNASYKPITKITDEMKKLQERSKQKVGSNPEGLTEKEKKKITEELKKIYERFQELSKEYTAFTPDIDLEEDEGALEREHELLYAYISAHPLDAYKEAYKDRKIRMIDGITEDSPEAHYIGMIKDIRKTKRKSDGKEMAFFTLEDISGSIEVCCFTSAYEKYGNFVQEGMVADLYCRTVSEETEREEPELKLVVKSIQKVRPYVDPIFFSVKDEEMAKELISYCKEFEDENGHPMILHIQETGNMDHVELRLKKEVLDQLPNTYFARILYEYKKWEYRRRI